MKSPHPDHSIPTVARNGCNAQSRVVHRAPPPFPGTNTVNRPYEADHQHTPSTDGNPPTAQASGTPSTGVPRPMVIDALLRLLVYHWTGQELVQSNGSVEPQRATLDRLYRALCATSTGRMNLPSDWVGNDVPPLARRLLPHLIRIAYTELVSNEDPWDESQGTANETETIHSELNADVHSEFIDHFTSCVLISPLTLSSAVHQSNNSPIVEPHPLIYSFERNKATIASSLFITESCNLCLLILMLGKMLLDLQV